MALGKRQEIVIVSANAERGAAVSGVVEAGNGRQRLREQALLHFARDFDLAIQTLALRDFVGDLAHEVCVLEREAGLCGDGLQQAHVGTRVRLLGFFRTERDESEKLIAHSKRQKQFGLQTGELAALFVGDVRVAIEPRIEVVQVDARGFLLLLQQARGGGDRREGDPGEVSVSHGIGRSVETIAAEQHGDLRHVERLRDARRHGFEQRLRFDHGANLLAKFGEDLFGVVGFAEETAIEPGAQLVRELADAQHKNDADEDHAEFQKASVRRVTENLDRCEGDGDHEKNLQSAHAIFRECILQSLAQRHAHAHGLVDDDHVSESERKQNQRRKRSEDGPLRERHRGAIFPGDARRR